MIQLRTFRDISYFPSVCWDGVNDVVYNLASEMDQSTVPFWIYPLAGGNVTVRAFIRNTFVQNLYNYSPDPPVIEYKNRSGNWTSVTFPGGEFSNYRTATISVQAGKPVQFRSTTGLFVTATSIIGGGGGISIGGGGSNELTTLYYPGSFGSDIPCVIGGNPASLKLGENLTGTWSNPASTMNSLFKNWRNLLDASLLYLPIEPLNSTFSGCTSLREAPLLSFTGSLRGGAWENLFKDCVSLSEINATFSGITTQTNNITHSLSGWVDGTETGRRELHLPQGSSVDTSDLCLNQNWTVKKDLIS